MIYYWLHIFIVFVASKLFWKKIDLASNLSRSRIVSIWDCDALHYMANSKYFYYMDMIRLEMMFRTDLYKNTAKKGCYPVIGSQKIIYKKPLKRWTKFNVTLILDGWDDNWVYHKQIFERNNEIYAIGYTKVGFWKNKKIQDIREIIFKSGIKKPKMDVPIETLNFFKEDYKIIKRNNF